MKRTQAASEAAGFSRHPGLLEQMCQAMTTAHEGAWVKEIFVTFRLEKPEVFDPALVDNVRELARRRQALGCESSAEKRRQFQDKKTDDVPR